MASLEALPYSETSTSLQKKHMIPLLKKTIVLLGTISLLALGAGCKTAEGFGDDVEDAADEVEDVFD